MRHSWPVIIFGGIVLGWIVALIWFALCLSDTIHFLPGRERWLGIVVNLFFLLVVTFSGWRIRHRRFALAVTGGTFLVLVYLLALWPSVLALFGSPPWGDKIVKIPFSAATPYMCDTWAWQYPNQDDNVR